MTTIRQPLHLLDHAVNVWEGTMHVFPSNVATLHAARAALDDIGDSLRQCFKVDTSVTAS
jgi:hypothetical protein